MDPSRINLEDDQHGLSGIAFRPGNQATYLGRENGMPVWSVAIRVQPGEEIQTVEATELGEKRPRLIQPGELFAALEVLAMPGEESFRVGAAFALTGVELRGADEGRVADFAELLRQAAADKGWPLDLRLVGETRNLQLTDQGRLILRNLAEKLLTEGHAVSRLPASGRLALSESALARLRKRIARRNLLAYKMHDHWYIVLENLAPDGAEAARRAYGREADEPTSQAESLSAVEEADAAWLPAELREAEDSEAVQTQVEALSADRAPQTEFLVWTPAASLLQDAGARSAQLADDIPSGEIPENQAAEGSTESTVDWESAPDQPGDMDDSASTLDTLAEAELQSDRPSMTLIDSARPADSSTADVAEAAGSHDESTLAAPTEPEADHESAHSFADVELAAADGEETDQPLTLNADEQADEAIADSEPVEESTEPEQIAALDTAESLQDSLGSSAEPAVEEFPEAEVDVQDQTAGWAELPDAAAVEQVADEAEAIDAASVASDQVEELDAAIDEAEDGHDDQETAATVSPAGDTLVAQTDDRTGEPGELVADDTSLIPALAGDVRESATGRNGRPLIEHLEHEVEFLRRQLEVRDHQIASLVETNDRKDRLVERFSDRLFDETSTAHGAEWTENGSGLMRQLDSVRDDWVQPFVDQIRDLERQIGQLQLERDQIAERATSELRAENESLRARIRELEEARSAPTAADGLPSRQSWWRRIFG